MCVLIVLNLWTMKNNFRLIAITLVFVFTGLFLAFLSWQEKDLDFFDNCEFNEIKFSVNEEVPNYKVGSFCVCAQSGIIECIPLENEVGEINISEQEVKKDGLEFEYNYLTGIGVSDSEVIFNTTFTDVSLNDDLVVTLEQMQSCPEANVVFNQEGFYENVNGAIKFYNQIEEGEGIDCVVELKYTLGDFVDFDSEQMQILFIDHNGFEIQAPICLYEGKVYIDEDVFRGEDGMICICENNEIICDEELPD